MRFSARLSTQSQWIVAILLAASLLHGCGIHNFVRHIGFPLADSEIVINVNPSNIIYDEYFIKAKLTPARAKALRNSFLSHQSSRFGVVPVAPKDMVLLTGNAQWNPRAVKKFWAGEFDKTDEGYDYGCMYIFDTQNPNYVILYFHAIAALHDH